jgi:hypothetical protein
MKPTPLHLVACTGDLIEPKSIRIVMIANAVEMAVSLLKKISHLM